MTLLKTHRITFTNGVECQFIYDICKVNVTRIYSLRTPNFAVVFLVDRRPLRKFSDVYSTKDSLLSGRLRTTHCVKVQTVYQLLLIMLVILSCHPELQ